VGLILNLGAGQFHHKFKYAASHPGPQDWWIIGRIGGATTRRSRLDSDFANDVAAWKIACKTVEYANDNRTESDRSSKP
jgi:hypothetical protein